MKNATIAARLAAFDDLNSPDDVTAFFAGLSALSADDKKGVIDEIEKFFVGEFLEDLPPAAELAFMQGSILMLKDSGTRQMRDEFNELVGLPIKEAQMAAHAIHSIVAEKAADAHPTLQKYAQLLSEMTDEDYNDSLSHTLVMLKTIGAGEGRKPAPPQNPFRPRKS